jgi:hypothetical protein
MSFCCGASMIGTTGTLKYAQTHIQRVPLLLCPVCFRVEVHHLVAQEYEIIAEFAAGDGAVEIDFQEFVNIEDQTGLRENCVNTEEEDPLHVVYTQINMALDLMSVAQQLADESWLQQLKTRLTALSKRKERLLQKRSRSSETP